jgi:hypothetical protein
VEERAISRAIGEELEVEGGLGAVAEGIVVVGAWGVGEGL